MIKRIEKLQKNLKNMNRTIVTYETFHGSAKKIAEVISNKLNCKCINVDTPFEGEDLTEIDNIILVFNLNKISFDKIVNRVVSNIQNSVRDSVSIKGNDPFSKLAKELNF